MSKLGWLPKEDFVTAIEDSTEVIVIYKDAYDIDSEKSYHFENDVRLQRTQELEKELEERFGFKI